MLAYELRCQTWFQVRFKRDSRLQLAVGNVEQLIGTGRMREDCHVAPEVVRQAVAFQRRQAVLEADINKESSQDE